MIKKKLPHYTRKTATMHEFPQPKQAGQDTGRIILNRVPGNKMERGL